MSPTTSPTEFNIRLTMLASLASVLRSNFSRDPHFRDLDAENIDWAIEELRSLTEHAKTSALTLGLKKGREEVVDRLGNP